MSKIRKSEFAKKLTCSHIVRLCSECLCSVKAKGDAFAIYLDPRDIHSGLGTKIKAFQSSAASRSARLKVLPLLADAQIQASIVRRVAIDVVNDKAGRAWKHLTVQVGLLARALFSRAASAYNVAMTVAAPRKSGQSGISLTDQREANDRTVPVFQRYAHIAPIIT